MGHVYADITIRNHIDVADAARGLIPADAVREVRLERVMVDTGASTLCLPAPLVAQLGLPHVRDMTVTTASGPQVTRMFEDAEVIVEGRRGSFRCFELPEGAPPLLGVLPMEELGLEPDVKNHRLRLLPEEPGNTHFFVM